MFENQDSIDIGGADELRSIPLRVRVPEGPNALRKSGEIETTALIIPILSSVLAPQRLEVADMSQRTMFVRTIV
jgi:hypothetical protein